MLLITARVNRALGKYKSSGLSPARCIIYLVQNNLNNIISPSLGYLPKSGFLSYTFGCSSPRIVVYASNALMAQKYPFIRLSSYCENRNPLRFTFDLYVIDLSEASFRTLSSSEL